MAEDLKCTIIDRYCELFDVYKSGDVDAMVKYYTTDCKSIMDHGVECGHEGIKNTCKKFAASKATFNFKKEECEVIISDDGSLAYLTVKLEICKADGTKSGSGTNLCIFRKIDGVYLVSVDMYA
ncbi:uncharacterized protein LOC144437859 [Glandiceps talaboti]